MHRDVTLIKFLLTWLEELDDFQPNCEGHAIHFIRPNLVTFSKAKHILRREFRCSNTVESNLSTTRECKHHIEMKCIVRAAICV